MSALYFDPSVHCMRSQLTDAYAEVDRLRAKTAALVEAMRRIEGYLERWADEPECGSFYEIAIAAIAEAIAADTETASKTESAS